MAKAHALRGAGEKKRHPADGLNERAGPVHGETSHGETGTLGEQSEGQRQFTSVCVCVHARVVRMSRQTPAPFRSDGSQWDAGSAADL